MKRIGLVLALAGCWHDKPGAPPLRPLDPSHGAANDERATSAHRDARPERFIVDTDVTTLAELHVLGICVDGDGHLGIAGTTNLDVSGTEVVIGGRGVGSVTAQNEATLNLKALDATEIWVLLDNDVAPVTINVAAPLAVAHIAVTSTKRMTVNGVTKLTQYMANPQSTGGWGLPPAFPHCNE